MYGSCYWNLSKLLYYKNKSGQKIMQEFFKVRNQPFTYNIQWGSVVLQAKSSYQYLYTQMIVKGGMVPILLDIFKSVAIEESYTCSLVFLVYLCVNWHEKIHLYFLQDSRTPVLQIFVLLYFQRLCSN